MFKIFGAAGALVVALFALVLAAGHDARASVGTQNTTIAAANLAVDVNSASPVTILAATIPGSTLLGGGGVVIEAEGKLSQQNVAGDTLTLDVTFAQGANSITRSYPIPVPQQPSFGNAFRARIGMAQRDAGALVYVLDAQVGGASPVSNEAAWGVAPVFDSSAVAAVGPGSLGVALDFTQPIDVTFAGRWATAAAGTLLRVTGAWATTR